jgi:DNA ligase-1
MMTKDEKEKIEAVRDRLLGASVFRPMLAATLDPAKLNFPYLASPKIDGVRAIVRDGVVYSRSNTPIPNKAIQEKFCWCDHFDGELVVGKPFGKGVFNRTVSVVMSADAPASDVHFHIFDHIEDPKLSYEDRYDLIGPDDVFDTWRVPHVKVISFNGIEQVNASWLKEGYEGTILRRPDSPYKNGRSTVDEGYLLKYKQFVDDEAEIIGFVEKMHNANPLTVNKLGLAKRSSHKANMVPMGTLGGFLCRTRDGVEFICGTGLTDEDRQYFWKYRSLFLGKFLKYKHFPKGAKTAPRHAVFLGIRPVMDM